jgi:predicted transcriptional regulator
MFQGYTIGMKTAISIPDEVFQGADRLARQLSISRSQLFSRALKEYLSRHAPDSVTDALDRLCGEFDEEPDRFVAAASRRILERTEW